MTRFDGPRSLAPGDDTAGFSSGEPAIDAWLAERALKAERAQTARTYVVTDAATGAIAGYYCLSSHSVTRGDVGGGWLARNAPDPVPVVLLGRLGIDTRYQGQRLGAALLKDALVKAVAVARLIGARALLVHALSTGVTEFYEKYGFRKMPSNTQTLYLPLDRLTLNPRV